MKTFQFKFSDQIASFGNYLDFYLKKKPTDCILYSEDGSRFGVHKELFGKTDFLRKILSSTNEQCCGPIDIFCPCSKEELSHLVNFLYNGKINCEKESDYLKIIDNLLQIFGFPGNLDLNYPNATFSTSVYNIEAVTITEEVYENILDNSDAQIIPIRSKNVNGKLVACDPFKEDDSEKKVLRKKKKPQKISCKEINGLSMKNLSKEFKCSDCGASFTTKRAIEFHINAIHLKVKPYECEQCKKSFTQEGHMKFHVKEVHQKVRPYKCIHCDHFFSRKPDLAKHVERVHLEQKPFKGFVCNECQAAFERKQLLENHRNRVHLNVRSYECFLCEKSFFLKTEMKHHLKKTHNEETK